VSQHGLLLLVLALLLRFKSLMPKAQEHIRLLLAFYTLKSRWSVVVVVPLEVVQMLLMMLLLVWTVVIVLLVPHYLLQMVGRREQVLVHREAVLVVLPL